MTEPHTSNELEFQGTVLSWLNQELNRRHLGLELATQEPSKTDRRRNDLVVWRNRVSGHAFLTIELKTPATPITDLALLNDACQKAQRWEAPFFAIWNMQATELYRSPPGERPATPKDLLTQFPMIGRVRSVDDWIDPACREHLRERTLELLDASYAIACQEGIELRIDASVFVDRLATRIRELRAETVPVLSQLANRRKTLRRRMREIAATQGFLDLVDEVPAAIAGQYCYRLVGQILFYFALRRKQPSLKPLELPADVPFRAAVRPHWDKVRHFDYEALFEPHELDKLVPLTPHAEKLLRHLVTDFARYDWNTLSDDVLGSIFEQLIPQQEQMLLGQFYTPAPVADLLIALALDGDCPSVLDPGCGSGTFLLRTYQYLLETRQLDHGTLLSNIWGFDISPFAAELAVINLFRQDLSEFNNFPRVLCGDFFERTTGERVDFPPTRGGIQSRVALAIPQFDAVVANPPYLRSQHQDDLDPEYKTQLFGVVLREHGIEVPPKTDLFAFFAYHSHSFLKVGGRLAFVTSSSWLTANYGFRLQRFLLEKFKLVAVIGSDAESFFTQVEQNTVLFVAEKREPDTRPGSDELVRFVTLKRPIKEICKPGLQYWANVTNLVDRIETTTDSDEDATARITCVSSASELAALQSQTTPRNWSVYLRAPAQYWQMVEATPGAFVDLGELAEVHLGYKSLQNQFYYVKEDTVDAYGIEDQYLQPIFRLDDIESDRFRQSDDTDTYVFVCDSSLTDIRGTGARRYIETMRGRPAGTRKQTTGHRTIEQALEKQSGSTWYAPKAVLNRSHVWLRKAFHGTYAPLVFEDAQVLDQRCNFVNAKGRLQWTEVAAMLTSSVLALSVEAAGSASMGAGVLELPTTKLARVRVPDIRDLSPRQKEHLVQLARTVWDREEPVNWIDPAPHVPKAIRELDQFLLDAFGGKLSTQQLYLGIKAAVATRRRIAEAKGKAQKAARKADVAAVAEGIVKGLKRQTDAARFPESFLPELCATLPLELDPHRPYSLYHQSFLGTVHVRVEDADGHTEYEGSFDHAVGEVLARALMLGRRRLEFPSEETIAVAALRNFFGWIRPILDSLDEACVSSSLGSRYDTDVLDAVHQQLGWSTHVADADLAEHVSLPALTI